MEKIIEGMKVLEQIPIKDYTTLSGVLTVIGISMAIIATIILWIKTKPNYRVDFKSKLFKGFLFFYVFGLSMAVFSVIRFPWFYVETGKYTYKCVLEDNVSANYISDNFNVINVEDSVWTIKDK